MFENNWESLNSRKVPEWFGKAKFGIFIHWGLYSIPAYAPKKDYAEWYGYSCNMEKCETEAQEKYKAYHKKHYNHYTLSADKLKAVFRTFIKN